MNNYWIEFTNTNHPNTRDSWVKGKYKEYDFELICSVIWCDKLTNSYNDESPIKKFYLYNNNYYWRGDDGVLDKYVTHFCPIPKPV